MPIEIGDPFGIKAIGFTAWHGFNNPGNTQNHPESTFRNDGPHRSLVLTRTFHSDDNLGKSSFHSWLRGSPSNCFLLFISE